MHWKINIFKKMVVCIFYYRDKWGFWGWLKRPFLKADIKPFNITEINASKKMNKADV